MMTLSIDLTDGQVVPALLYTVTRVDGTVERVTNATRDVTTASPLSVVTWTAMGGFKSGVLTQRNDGTPPVLGFDVTLTSAGKFRFRSVDRGLYERANVLVELTDVANPVTKDFIFEGLMLGTISYDIAGQASFELISKYAVPRDIFVKKFLLGCDHMFGDPLTCGVPVFPYSLGDDLADVARNEVIGLGARRRFRFTTDGDEDDYANVYLEATVAGTTSGSAPSISSTVGATSTDGTVMWTTQNAYARSVRIAATDGVRTLTMDRDPDPRGLSDNTWFTPGKLLFMTGEYKGRVFSGANWNGAARTWDVYLPCPYAAVNDWALFSPGCDRTYARCLGTFANTLNHGGNPFQLGAKAQTQQMGLT